MQLDTVSILFHPFHMISFQNILVFLLYNLPDASAIPISDPAWHQLVHYIYDGDGTWEIEFLMWQFTPQAITERLSENKVVTYHNLVRNLWSKIFLTLYISVVCGVTINNLLSIHLYYLEYCFFSKLQNTYDHTSIINI